MEGKKDEMEVGGNSKGRGGQGEEGVGGRYGKIRIDEKWWSGTRRGRY